MTYINQPAAHKRWRDFGEANDSSQKYGVIMG